VRARGRRVSGIVDGIARVHRAVLVGLNSSVGVRLRGDDRGARSVSGCRGPRILRTICVNPFVRARGRRVSGIVDGIARVHRAVLVGLNISV